MEENEETSSNLNKSPDFDKGDTLLETEELKITDECGFVTDSVPKLDEFVSVVEDSKPVKEDEGLSAVNEMQNLVTEVEDYGVGGDEVKILGMEGTEKTEVAGEEEERETSVVGGGGNFVAELSELQFGGVEAVSEVKDSRHGGEDANEMELKADSKVDANEMELKADSKVDGNEMELKADSKVDANDMEVKADSKVESEAEAVCGAEAEVEAKLKPESDKEDESDKDDDVGMEEKPEMELVAGDDGRRETISKVSGEEVGSESQNAAEEIMGRENLKLGTDLDDVAEDTVLEEENLAMEVVTETKVGEPESVPKFNDEEDEMETENEDEEAKVDGGEPVPQLDDLQLAVAEDEDEEDETMVEEEEIPAADTEMETETDAAESVKVSGGKRKRGRNSKVTAKAPGQKTTILVEEEDVCFICFDGGDLVLCDRKNCPKAYHPSCVNRDEKFFQAKGRWNCGWHQCSNKKCQKNAYYMCYTCTFSLCKGCVKDAVILCVKGNKGFCEACMKIVMLIEDSEQGNKSQIDFDDKTSWEYLYKDYWIDLKEKLSISSVELAQAKNPWKGSDILAGKHESPDEHLDVKDDGGSGSDNASDNPEASKSKSRKAKKRLKPRAKQDQLTSEAVAAGAAGTSTPKNTEWASKELLEFVMHMKDGDKAVLSQFDVQALLLEYIKRNKLRDPRRKSQIICDARLENIFGKARVGHFEMLKLLESHFLIKEDAQIDDVRGSVVDTEVNHLDADGNTESLTKGGKDRKRKTRRKDGRGRQYNLEDYAAIDIHNISLIYLKRKLMEDLLEDIETFSDKVVGTFVRIRISGSNQKQDIYRLVQVVGTSKADELYKVGKRTTDIMLEILNLSKTEIIPIDTISNQEFTEDECKRLRQSIKCGLISRLTVGDILDKAMEVQVARVNDWLESELLRLSHLRDRASDLGKKKQLRECVESLQLLKTPEERRRRLEDVPEIHADPNMDPSFESEDNDSEMDTNKQEVYMRPRGSGFSRRGREPISPGRGDLKDSWSGARKNSGKGWDLNRNLSNKNSANKVEDASLNIEISADNSWNQGRGKDTEKHNNFEKPSLATSSEAFGLNRHSVVRSESFSHVVTQNSPASRSASVATTVADISETDKTWHYQDPSGKVQGPFSMVQLRKWSNTGYFPTDLQIWRTNGNKDDSILLTDALAGKFQRELPPDNGNPNAKTLHSPHLPSTHTGKPYETSLQQGREAQDGEKSSSNQKHVAMDSHVNSASRGWAPPSVEVPILSADGINSDYDSRNISVNLPSPTPRQSTAGWAGGEVGPYMAAVSPSGGNEALQSPAAATPDSFRSLTMVSEKSPLSSRSGFNAPPNSEQGILISSTNSLQTSQLTATIESQGLQSRNHMIPAPETNAIVVQSVTSPNPAFGTHGWGSAPSQSLEANSSIHMSGGQLGYGQYGGVPSTPVQTPAGNFQTQGVSSMPLPDAWRPPISNNQSNMQPPAPLNLPWGVGIAENSASAQNIQPGNPNSGWGAMPVNPNMGWGGHVPNPNMNWVASVQGAPPGNANPGWVLPTGNPGAGFQGAVPGNLNPGWVAPPANAGAIAQVLGPMNANQGWVTPTANMGPNAQGPVHGNGNQGWPTPTGNLGPNVQGPASGNANSGWVAPTSGNTNPGWGSPAGSQGNRRNEDHHKGDKFSGQRDRGSQRGLPWNTQSSFGGGGSGGSGGSARGQCYMFQRNGHCKRGASCKFQHT